MRHSTETRWNHKIFWARAVNYHTYTVQINAEDYVSFDRNQMEREQYLLWIFSCHFSESSIHIRIIYLCYTGLDGTQSKIRQINYFSWGG